MYVIGAVVVAAIILLIVIAIITASHGPNASERALVGQCVNAPNPDQVEIVSCEEIHTGRISQVVVGQPSDCRSGTTPFRLDPSRHPETTQDHFACYVADSSMSAPATASPSSS